MRRAPDEPRASLLTIRSLSQCARDEQRGDAKQRRSGLALYSGWSSTGGRTRGLSLASGRRLSHAAAISCDYGADARIERAPAGKSLASAESDVIEGEGAPAVSAPPRQPRGTNSSSRRCRAPDAAVVVAWKATVDIRGR